MLRKDWTLLPPVLPTEKQIKQLQEHVDQQENHSHRCYVRVLKIEEQKEGTNTVKYIEKWKPEYFYLDTTDWRIVVDRTHRSLAPMRSTGQKPLPLIVTFHYYSDKVRVMDDARQRRLQ